MLKIAELEHPLKELPLLPSVVSRLLAIDRDSDQYFEDVLELAQEDPTFAVRVMHLSNTTYSHPLIPITKLRDAMARLGADQIAHLVSSMHVGRVFFPTTTGEKSLWVHAVQVAVGAREIAKAAPGLLIDPEEAYLCGLLHDIGRFVVFEKAVKELHSVDEHNWRSPTQLVEVETRLYGFDHAQLGWKLCNDWGVPSRVAAVVKHHHHPELPTEISVDKSLAHLINVVQVADFFSVFMLLEPEFDELPTEELELLLDEKCIQPSCFHNPISASQLRELSTVILEESEAVVGRLGIYPSHCTQPEAEPA